MSRSAIVFVLFMQVLFSLGYMFFAGYILYRKTANKTWKMHGLGCIELTYDSKEWVLTFFFIILLFSTCIKNKSQNLSTKNYKNKTRYSDNGSKRKVQKKKKRVKNSIIHPTSDRPWWIHLFISISAQFFIIFNFNFQSFKHSALKLFLCFGWFFSESGWLLFKIVHKRIDEVSKLRK